MKRICFEVVETEQYPSLTYLDALRPDVVKLDRSLISGIDGDPPRQRLVGALIDYAHELDVRVVAEGIETQAELAVIAELGADLGQGWYLGRPAVEPVPVARRLVVDAVRTPREAGY
jgi:EAL domain-containing protein (putative c-di-GMP-specific phosphodiesterase class I)